MKRRQLIVLGLLLGMLQLASGQLVNQACVQSLGGGVSSGGNYASIVVAGDVAASSEIGQRGETAVYSGFIPGNFIILSFGLAKDSVILATLYKSLGGENWFNQGNWMVGNIDTWEGVTITSQRVTALALDSNNLQNNLPEVIKSMSKLESLDLSDNELRKLPNMSGMPALASLDVSENRLGFESLVANKGIATYHYAPQKRYGYTQSDTLAAGESFVLQSGIPGATAYQWVFDDFPAPDEAVNIPGATGTILTVDSLIYSNMGSYRLTATSNQLAGLTLETRNQNIWASTDIAGRVFADDQGTPLTSGQVEVYRVSDGPFVLSDSSVLSPEGDYLIEEVVLGDFILLVKNDVDDFPDVIQTYYVSTEDWLSADTLLLRTRLEDIDINMVFKPTPVADPSGADFEGAIYTELPPADTVIDEESRVAARRTVKRAGCSMRRFVSRGRGEQEGEYVLYAYVESDDEGRFNFADVEEGRYQLNIQYPGVPMDPASVIEFEVGGDKENQLFSIEALITEDGIIVDSREVLSSPKPYLKEVVLYPNPTEGKIVADFLVYRKLKDLRAIVQDIRGLQVLEQELNPVTGWQRTEMDLTGFNSGIYFLVFTDKANTFRHQAKIIKQ